MRLFLGALGETGRTGVPLCLVACFVRTDGTDWLIGWLTGLSVLVKRSHVLMFSCAAAWLLGTSSPVNVAHIHARRTPMPCSPHACPLSDRAAAAAAGAAEARESRRTKSMRRLFSGLSLLLSLALPLRFFAAPTVVDALLPASTLPSVLRQRRTTRSVMDSPKLLAKSGKLDEGPGPSKGEETDRDSRTVSLSPPVLELITPNGCASAADPAFLIRSVQRAVAGGVSLLQLRDNDSDSESKAELARRLRSAIDGRALFVLNGEPDAARACGADGVHLPERMVQSLVGLRGLGEWPRVVGCSVHSVAAAVKAARLGADYVQVWNARMFPIFRVFLIMHC